MNRNEICFDEAGHDNSRNKNRCDMDIMYVHLEAAQGANWDIDCMRFSNLSVRTHDKPVVYQLDL